MSTSRCLVSHPRSLRVRTKRYDCYGGELLRKAVCGVVRGTNVNGQVEAYHGKSVAVRHGDNADRLVASRLDNIAPVACLLLLSPTLKTSDITRMALRDFNNTVLDRIIGNNGFAGSRNIADILNGILPRNQQPHGSELRIWVNPTTGITSTFRLQHAVDYAHFIDGDHPVPASLEHEIGETFTDDPIHREVAAPTEDASPSQPQPRLRPFRQLATASGTRTRHETRTRPETRTRTRIRTPISPPDRTVTPTKNTTPTALLSEIEGDGPDESGTLVNTGV
ncbi:hypothetical protein ON010_g3361 [Phytophthora cinnamomi]|nr:hypothetical protein ON010_g3361 [Phytophthora cinnamomi]